MDSLSEEQREMLKKIDVRAALMPRSPEDAEPQSTTPRTTTTYNSTAWVNHKPGPASSVEVRVLGALLVVLISVMLLVLLVLHLPALALR